MSEEKKHKNNLILRGIKRPNHVGNGTFVGLRSLAPVLQYGILGRGLGLSLLHKAGIKTLPQGPPLVTGTVLDQLSLSPCESVRTCNTVFVCGVAMTPLELEWE